MSVNLLGGSHLLNALGFNVGGFEENLQDFGDRPELLQQLQDHFRMAAGHMAAGHALANLIQSGGLPSAGVMAPPQMGGCPCSERFAQPQTFDFGQAQSSPFGLGALFGGRKRRKAKKLEKLLGRNPFARAQVEMMLGGRIVPDGREDGRITVQPFTSGGFPGGASPQALTAMATLDQIQRGAMSSGSMPGQDAMYQSMMLGAMANMLGPSAYSGGGLPGAAGGGSPYVDWADSPRPPHQAGQNGPHQGRFGIAPGGGDEVTNVLNDPSLTVEDKVTLMIMLIMKKMDKDIEKQANYINSLQQQQQGGGGSGGSGGSGGGGGGGKGGGSSGGGKGGGGSGGGGSPSIDVETMKLKRMVDKRSQMFDMLRQIIDKYNQTAKGIIDSIGR